MKPIDPWGDTELNSPPTNEATVMVDVLQLCADKTRVMQSAVATQRQTVTPPSVDTGAMTMTCTAASLCTELLAQPQPVVVKAKRSTIALVATSSIAMIVLYAAAAWWRPLVNLVTRTQPEGAVSVAPSQMKSQPTQVATIHVALSALERDALVAKAVDALLAGHTQKALVHYRKLASATDDALWQRVVTVLGARP